MNISCLYIFEYERSTSTFILASKFQGLNMLLKYSFMLLLFSNSAQQLPVSNNSPLFGTTASPLSSVAGSATKQWKNGCSELNPSSSKTAT